MKEQFFTQDVFVGIANDYDKRITSYPNGDGLFKGKPGHNSYYVGFVRTPLGLKCLSNDKIYPVFKEHIYLRKDFACNVEPIIFYMEPHKVPTTMTKEEINFFVRDVYAPEKREEAYQSQIKGR